MHLSFGQARLFRVRALNPIVIVPRRMFRPFRAFHISRISAV